MKITNESVHLALDDALSTISLSERARVRILQQAREKSKIRRFRRPILRRTLATAASFAAALVFATGVLASVPGLAEKLNMLSRQTLSFFTPVEQETTANEIRMEVIAAMNDGDTAVVYVALKDLSDQNRLDETVSVPDIHLTGMYDTICENVYKNPDGTVILRLTGTSETGSLANRKVSLQLHSILSQNVYEEAIDTGYTVEDIERENPNPELGGVSVPESYEIDGTLDGPLYNLLEGNRYQQLLAMDSCTKDVLPWLKVLNYGTVDNVLHILTDPNDDTWYNTARFYLASADGAAYDTETAVVDLDEKNLDRRHGYESGCFADLQDQLIALPENVPKTDMHLFYSKDEYNKCMDGNWNITFALQEVPPGIAADCRLDMQTWTTDSVTVSPISVTVNGTGLLEEQTRELSVCLTMRDGTVYENFGSASTMITPAEDGSDKDEIQEKFYFDEPVLMDEVAEITINGESVWQAE